MLLGDHREIRHTVMLHKAQTGSMVFEMKCKQAVWLLLQLQQVGVLEAAL